MATNPYSDIDDEEAVPLALKPEPELVAGDRGEPTTKSTRKRKTGMIIGIIVVIIFSLLAVGSFGYFFYKAVTKKYATPVADATDPALSPRDNGNTDLNQVKEKFKREEEAKRRRDEEAEAENARNASNTNEPTESTAGSVSTVSASDKPSRGRYSEQTSSNTGRASQTANSREMSPKEMAEVRKYRGGVLWETGTGDSSNHETAGEQPTKAKSNSSGDLTAEERYAQANASRDSEGSNKLGEGSGSSQNIGDLLKTEKLENGSVTARSDLKFLLINGTNIPCTQIPRIVTDYPAGISCLVNRDVYSADGSVLLIAKGSVARGERKVSLKQGQAMVFVSWGNIDTTDGLKLNIDSMAADNLGAAGIKADIDNHYSQRFGGAILLSFLDDVFQAVAKNNSTTNGINFDSSTRNAQDMASIALQQSINIPPTGYVKHASELNIIVARDIDFRNVYGVN